MKQKAELNSKKQRDREAVSDESASDRGGMFPGLQEYSGCLKRESKTHFARNCSAKNREDPPQKKKFRIRRDIDESDDKTLIGLKMSMEL